MMCKTRVLLVCLLVGMAWVILNLIPVAVVQSQEPEPIPTPPPLLLTVRPYT